ncbi:MAG TPA: YqgE/AlgH family protein [Rhizomicrobium sp.]|jgi:putative transcriptional regulator|nr:YqgE/AlgH family protein [Rhizomicrobium sp.]
MESEERTKTSGSENFLEGKLLIALPGMGDPRFDRSVIYMCAHSGTGAMGLIVNKPIEGLGLQDLLQRLDLPVTDRTPNSPVLFGGPVETGRGFVLHSGEYESAEATLPISSDISLTATLDILRAISEGRGPREALFALGYAGWGPGQIESEIQANGWIHCDADAGVIFGAAMDSKWSTALRKLGISVSALSAHSGHA